MQLNESQNAYCHLSPFQFFLNLFPNKRKQILVYSFQNNFSSSFIFIWFENLAKKKIEKKLDFNFINFHLLIFCLHNTFFLLWLKSLERNKKKDL